MTVDALFPARAALERFFPQQIYPQPQNPTWAHGRKIEKEALHLVEPLLHIMALAGWRAVTVHYKYHDFDNEMAGTWVNIDLAARTSTVAAYPDGGSTALGDARIAVTFEKLMNPDGSSHAVTNINEFSLGWNASSSIQPLFSTQPGPTSLRLMWQTEELHAHYNMPSWGATETEQDNWTLHWEEQREELGGKVLDLCGVVLDALHNAVLALQTAAGSDEDAWDAIRLPGMLWLFNPATWAADANYNFRDDPFVNVIRDQADKVWHKLRSTKSFHTLTILEKTVRSEASTGWEEYQAEFPQSSDRPNEEEPTTASLDAYMGLFFPEARNYEDFAEKAEEFGVSLQAPDDMVAPQSPFRGLSRSVTYFDLLCALVQTRRIAPPDLDTANLIGNFEEALDGDDEPEDGAIVAMYGTLEGDGFNGEQYIALFVFGEYAIQLIQPHHHRYPHLTPDIRDQAAWEYKGEQHDGSHVVALTLGRGVQMKDDFSRSYNIKTDVFRAQSASDFRRPKIGPAQLEEVDVPAADLVFYDDETRTLPGAQPVPKMVDDLSVTAAQALDHTILRQGNTITVQVPQTLTNLPGPTIGDVPAILHNFSHDNPPVFIVRTLECGAMRFEWYREGLNHDTPQLTYGLTIRKNTSVQDVQGKTELKGTDNGTTSKDASIGICWALDDAYTLHEPLTEDLLYKVISAAVQDGILLNLNIATLGLPYWLGENTWFEGGHAEQTRDNALKPHGVSFFRLWYSGDDVRIDIDRISDSDESLRVEIVKVANVMDLPEQGFRLPARAVRMGNYEEVHQNPNDPSSPKIDVARTGLLQDVWAYDAMLDPDPNDEHIPIWSAENMPPLLQRHDTHGNVIGYHVDDVAQVAAVEHTGLTMYEGYAAGTWFSGVATYSDTRKFIVDPDNWAEWRDWFVTKSFEEEENRVPGRLKMTQTTDMLIATILVDIVVGFIPYVGTSTDVAEFLYAFETGQDKWGEPVAQWQLVLMGIAAAVPFVSGSAVKTLSGVAEQTLKRAENAKSLLSNTYPASIAGWAPGGMLGMSPGEDLISRGWRLFYPSNVDPTDVAKLEKPAKEVADRVGEIGGYADNLDHQAIIKRIAELTPEGVGPAYKVLSDAGGVAGRIVASAIHVDLSFIVQFENGTALQVRIPALINAFNAKNAKRAANAQLTFAQFLGRLKTSRGVLRAISDTFGLISYVGVRVNVGVPKKGDAWALMGDLVMTAAARQSPENLRALLRRPDHVRQLIDRLGQTAELAAKNADALRYLNTYRPHIKGLIKDLDATGQLGKLMGRKELDPDYVTLGLARILQHMEDSLIKNASPHRVATLFPEEGLLATANLGADLATQHATLLGAIADFAGMALKQVRFPHAYILELDVGIIVSKIARSGALEFVMDVTYGLKYGADATAFFAQGAVKCFNVIEAKSLARIAEQVGDLGVQPNLLQAMRTLFRWAENIARHGGPLDAGFTPAFSANKFGRRFFFVADWLHANSLGPVPAAKLFAYTGEEIAMEASRVPAAVRDLIGVADGPFERALNIGGKIYFNDLTEWIRASKMMDADALEEVLQSVMRMQADDIRTTLLALQDPVRLQALMDMGDRIGRRISANLVALVNERSAWLARSGQNGKLPSDYFLQTFMVNGQAITGAQEFFNISGVSHVWQNVFKIDPNDATEAVDYSVEVLNRAGLLEKAEDAFGMLPRKAISEVDP